jgi:hypothetical protein
MSALLEYRIELGLDFVHALCLERILFCKERMSGSFPGGEAEIQIVREQLSLLKRYGELQHERMRLVDNLLDEIESQQQDAAADH